VNWPFFNWRLFPMHTASNQYLISFEKKNLIFRPKSWLKIMIFIWVGVVYFVEKSSQLGFYNMKFHAICRTSIQFDVILHVYVSPPKNNLSWFAFFQLLCFLQLKIKAFTSFLSHSLSLYFYANIISLQIIESRKKLRKKALIIKFKKNIKCT
jgi:hypothetical protein